MPFEQLHTHKAYRYMHYALWANATRKEKRERKWEPDTLMVILLLLEQLLLSLLLLLLLLLLPPDTWTHEG